jgi:hypothetical protein
MRNLLMKVFGLGEWKSLVWKHRIQGAAIATLIILALLLLSGCTQPKAQTDVLPGKSSARATAEEVRPREKSTKTITVRVIPPTTNKEKTE